MWNINTSPARYGAEQHIKFFVLYRSGARDGVTENVHLRSSLCIKEYEWGYSAPQLAWIHSHSTQILLLIPFSCVLTQSISIHCFLLWNNSVSQNFSCHFLPSCRSSVAHTATAISSTQKLRSSCYPFVKASEPRLFSHKAHQVLPHLVFILIFQAHEILSNC